MRKPVIFGAVVCLAAFLGSGVWPETAISQDARPAAAGDSILNIPACAFNEVYDGTDFTKDFQLRTDTGAGGFIAPINLPHGSIIKKIMLVCSDTNDSDEVDLRLWRYPNGSPIEILAHASSSGDTPGWRTFGQKLTTGKYVNTWKYSYYLSVYLPGTGDDGYILMKAKIVYTPPSP